jgi:hypothetical protein
MIGLLVKPPCPTRRLTFIHWVCQQRCTALPSLKRLLFNTVLYYIQQQYEYSNTVVTYIFERYHVQVPTPTESPTPLQYLGTVLTSPSVIISCHISSELQKPPSPFHAKCTLDSKTSRELNLLRYCAHASSFEAAAHSRSRASPGPDMVDN